MTLCERCGLNPATVGKLCRKCVTVADVGADREGVRKRIARECRKAHNQTDTRGVVSEQWLRVADYVLSLGATEAPRTELCPRCGGSGVEPGDPSWHDNPCVSCNRTGRAAPAAPGATPPEEGYFKETILYHSVPFVAPEGALGAARQPEADATPAPDSDPLWAFLESHLGLHAGVELLYVVDGYEVTLTDRDGRITLASGRGETLRDAVAVARQAFGPEVPE